MKNDIKRQLIKIARYYYDDGLTQEEIAKRMSLSRQKIGRLIQKLIPEGIVKISIDDSLDTYLDIEQALEKKYNLKEVVVVSTQESNQLTLDSIGRAGAQYLDRVLKPNNTIGIAWGRTLTYVSQHIVKERTNLNVSIVQLAGGVFPYGHFFNGELSRQSGEITRDISLKLGAKPYLMNNPLIVDNAESKKILLQESSVSNILKKAGSCDLAMVSIASLGKSVSPFIEGALGEEELKYLIDRKAVGNFLFHYFDIEGNIIDAPFYERLICPDIEVLKKIPMKVCISGTREKISAIYGGINGGFVDVLITDSGTATALLQK
ncbi:sugar-binding transcriptional regulator [Alkalibaculum sporogenes]|uniref:sugar-binding transcriptional regulator n=1 Tax=Alkalibaculum sporogenes TaxID=2655001 RepID=UPI00187B1E0F|nr:sugar-binding transcriptional regulator [Alkalibaculum sporogenes]